MAFHKLSSECYDIQRPDRLANCQFYEKRKKAGAPEFDVYLRSALTQNPFFFFL